MVDAPHTVEVGIFVVGPHVEVHFLQITLAGKIGRVEELVASPVVGLVQEIAAAPGGCCCDIEVVADCRHAQVVQSINSWWLQIRHIHHDGAGCVCIAQKITSLVVDHKLLSVLCKPAMMRAALAVLAQSGDALYIG